MTSSVCASFGFEPMNRQKTRILLFLVGCMGSRAFLVYLAYRCGQKNATVLCQRTLIVMAIMAILVSLAFMTIFLTGSRKTGPEVFGDVIWWNDLRPVHALMYLTFAIAAIFVPTQAYIPLLLDVIIGLVAFTWYHTRTIPITST